MPRPLHTRSRMEDRFRDLQVSTMNYFGHVACPGKGHTSTRGENQESQQSTETPVVYDVNCRRVKEVTVILWVFGTELQMNTTLTEDRHESSQRKRELGMDNPEWERRRTATPLTR